jgi:hypothetical protein
MSAGCPTHLITLILSSRQHQMMNTGGEARYVTISILPLFLLPQSKYSLLHLVFKHDSDNNNSVEHFYLFTSLLSSPRTKNKVRDNKRKKQNKHIVTNKRQNKATCIINKNNNSIPLF